jgi:serine/threonine protein kinase
MEKDKLVHVFKSGAFELKEEYIYLMTKFEVVIPVGPEEEYLLIPSKLPDSIDQAQSLQPRRPNMHQGKEASTVVAATKSIVCRFYYMIYVPSGFWPRLISRFLSSTQLHQMLSTVTILDPDLERMPSVAMPLWFYWKTGIELRVNCGSIMSIKEVSASQEGIIGAMAAATHGSLCLCLYGKPDILDTQDYRCIEVVVSQFSSREVYTDFEESNDIAIMLAAKLLANAVEVIDVLLEDWYPRMAFSGSTSKGNPFLTKIVPCPACLNAMVTAISQTKPKTAVKKNGSEVKKMLVERGDQVLLEIDIAFVFQLQECAMKAQSEKAIIQCPRHDELELAAMTPDLLFHDLKLSLIVDSRQLVEEKVIGQGAFADVCKGFYYPKCFEGNNISSTRMAVAIKKLEKRQHDSIRRHHEHCDQLRTDYLDTIAFKAYKAYLETRREVAVLATINHAHVIRFFGVQLSPRSLILEWAPMGSLDNVLEKYEDNSIAPRPFQQLMIQVADGLNYLHSHAIVYRDLKSSNILVWKFPEPGVQTKGGLQLNNNDRHGVLVKLADFGISRLVAPGGLARGESGTPGFMAPEIVLFHGDEAYTQKADIYSFAMLMYKVLCNQDPFAGYQHMEIDNFIRKGKRPELPKKVIQYPQCAVHLMQRCWAQQPKDRPTATQILEIVESEDFVRLLDVLQLLSGMEITACCLISADLLQVIQGTKDSDDSDDGHSESSPFDQGETEGNMKKDSPVCNSNHFCSMSMDNSEVNISDIDINLDADEVWLCEHRIGRPSYTNLDIAEYFRGEDSKFDETHDTIYYDVVCSMFVIGNHVVMATSNNPKIRIYGIENRSLCKEIALPLHLTEDKGVRQMIYVDDYLFLALHQGSIISLPANDVLSPISDRELMSMARVCHGQEEDLFCVVAVEKEDTACPATGIEIWCGLASGHIAIADSSSMEYITGIDVKLDHMSISDFVVNTVALMAVTYSKGQQTVWASVQPGTFVYGFLAKTREQIAHINCLPHLTGMLIGQKVLSALVKVIVVLDLALVPVSATHKYVRQISGLCLPH